MKLELKKAFNDEGELFYRVYLDDKLVKSFWGESSQAVIEENGNSVAHNSALELYHKIKDNGGPLTGETILHSQELNPPTNEPETQS